MGRNCHFLIISRPLVFATTNYIGHEVAMLVVIAYGNY